MPELKKLFKNPRDLYIDKKGSTTVKVFGGGRINVLGTTFLRLSRNGKNFEFKFLVVDRNAIAIIGCKDALKYGFILLPKKKQPIPDVKKIVNDADDFEGYEELFTG